MNADAPAPPAPAAPAAPLAIVVGGGIIGVAGAWQLARRGFRVRLLERRDDVALETSFANGGQVGASEVAPWSKPGTALRAAAWMLRPDAPFRWRPCADPGQWRWLWGFFSCCTPSANEQGLRSLFPLAQASIAELRRAREAARQEGWPLDYDAAQRGILRIFRSRRALEKERESGDLMEAWGAPRRILTQDECIDMEPALQFAPENLRGGGLFTPADESGDAHLCARALWQSAKAAGATARFGVEVEALRRMRDGRILPQLDGETLECDLLVLSAGCQSRELAGGLGISLPLWPVKGYSLTAEIAEPSHAPSISVTDEEKRTVFTRLGTRLRVAGLAEVARSTREGLDPSRARILVRNLEGLFPGAVDPGSIRFWRGFRPMMPDSVPLIGRAPGCENLWFNLGHGSLGWSLGMGSAALLAQLICGEQPLLDPRPYDPSLRLVPRKAAKLAA